MFVVLFVLTSAGITIGAKSGGFLTGYYKLLKPGPKGGVKQVWIKPGVDFGKYNKVILDGIVFYLSKNSSSQGIDPQALKDLADKGTKAIVDALQPTYQVVSDPGPDVMRLRIAITELKLGNPIMSGEIFAGGATGAEMMIRDSTTKDVIAVAKDERTMRSGASSEMGSADASFKFWAGRLKMFLDSSRAGK